MLDIENYTRKATLVRGCKEDFRERYYDVQLARPMLHRGKIAEMKTGEEKPCFNITSILKFFRGKGYCYSCDPRDCRMDGKVLII